MTEQSLAFLNTHLIQYFCLCVVTVMLFKILLVTLLMCFTIGHGLWRLGDIKSVRENQMWPEIGFLHTSWHFLFPASFQQERKRKLLPSPHTLPLSSSVKIPSVLCIVLQNRIAWWGGGGGSQGLFPWQLQRWKFLQCKAFIFVIVASFLQS